MEPPDNETAASEPLLAECPVDGLTGDLSSRRGDFSAELMPNENISRGPAHKMTVI
jgi:hypothetical protein